MTLYNNVLKSLNNVYTYQEKPFRFAQASFMDIYLAENGHFISIMSGETLIFLNVDFNISGNTLDKSIRRSTENS